MIRLVISNQRGGVAKTTTAVTLARSFADIGKKVLLIDTDSQGSIRTILGLKPEFHLADFLIRNMAFRECVVTACPNVDVMCSNRDTTEAEVTLSNSPFRELTFERLFSEHEAAYDVVLIDVAPSITLSQQCAMVYAQQVLVPVGMETLSLQGAVAAVNAAQALNRFFKKGLNVRTVGLLPVMVDRRLAMTAHGPRFPQAALCRYRGSRPARNPHGFRRAQGRAGQEIPGRFRSQFQGPGRLQRGRFPAPPKYWIQPSDVDESKEAKSA